MAALFTAASSQYLSLNPQPLVSSGYPFVVGAWVNLASTGTQRAIFGFTDTATTTNFLELRVLTTNVLSIGAAAGGATISTNLTNAISANTWVFVLGRFVNATTRRLSMLTANGVIEHGGGTVTSVAPAGLDTLTVGGFKTSAAAAEFWDGRIGEFWYLVGSFPSDGAASISDSVIHKLAYGGPFAIEYLYSALIEYHSYFDDVVSPELGQDFVNGQVQSWVNNNGVSIGGHPPLPYWFARPNQARRKLVV